MIGGWFNRFIQFFFDHLYTDLAWTYDAVAWLVSAGRWTKWQQVAVPYLPSGRILDVGCGPGHLVEALRAKSTHCFGIDSSTQMSRLASRNLRVAGSPGVICQGNAEKLPFASSSFSAVVSTFPSEYIMQSEVFEEIRRILKPSGQVVVVYGFRILGVSLIDRCLAVLFRVSHQSIKDEIMQLETTEVPGFTGGFERILESDAEVVCWVGSRNE